MKIFITILISMILFLTNPASAQTDSIKVLFLGNSYTQVNNLPNLFQELSASGGKTVIVDSNTPGGYTLNGHSTNVTSLQKISEDTWNYVILQEQSQIPTVEYHRYNTMYPAARILDSLIILNNGNTAFFMTWGRKFGGQQAWGGYSSPEFIDFFHMQDTLSSAYTEISDELGVTLCPVGNAWATAFGQDSTINLWSGDNSHPSLEGSYLAACVFYSVLFDANPYGLSYMAGIDPEIALFLQNAAYQTVVSIADQPMIPDDIELYQNYPNPFNANTIIKYNLNSDSNIKLTVHDIMGREVAALFNGYQSAGSQSISWDGTDNAGRNIASGIYFYILQTDQYSISKRMLLVK